MTTKQMKELYATGKWICVFFDEGYKEWSLFRDEHIKKLGFGDEQYKLIHIKHKEVLDHVLNGGEVNKHWGKLGLVKGWHLEEDFFGSYDRYNTYEIIPTKQENWNVWNEESKPKQSPSHGEFIEHQYEEGTLFEIKDSEEYGIKESKSLNGRYCLATPEHYEQLIKDGYEFDAYDSIDYKYYCVSDVDDRFIGTTMQVRSLYSPMHYHNNQWVFGSLEHEIAVTFKQDKTGFYVIDTVKGIKQDDSLEHEEEKTMEASYPPKECDTHKLVRTGIGEYVFNPKPPKRITREEAIDAFDGREYGYSGHIEFIDELFDYIEYLEANQKEK